MGTPWYRQVGYGPPQGNAPVNLGDYFGGETSKYSSSNPNEYGASVLVKDIKYISFATTADGPALR